MKSIKIKRIYEKAEDDDGYRMFVDRLWARGLTKEKAAINEWNKIIAPSSELRKWFGHKPEKFNQFSQSYTAELKSKPQELSRINSIARKQNLTLLYAARDEKINHAIVLLDVLQHPHEP
ncbi:MAG: DUF488 domain-containing protein [Chitinophagales bacterium]